MLILPNPVKELRNRAKHRLGFIRVAELLANPVFQQPDDRPLGYQEEGRIRVTGRVGMTVMRLVYEPVELESGEIAVRPISLRYASRQEEQQYWSIYE